MHAMFSHAGNVSSASSTLPITFGLRAMADQTKGQPFQHKEKDHETEERKNRRCGFKRQR